MRAVTFLAFALLPTVTFAAAPDARLACAPDDDKRLCALYRHDQEVRKGPIKDLKDLDDPASVRETRLIIGQNKLHSSSDYYRAATILLHSSNPDDYLLAHVVATAGISKDPAHPKVRLLAALSLDRYLLAKGQAQIFGTQLMVTASGPAMRGVVDCALIDGSLRFAFVGDYPEPCRNRSGAKPAALAQIGSRR